MKAVIAIIATLTAIVSLILINILDKKYSTLILGIEVILLPAIYIIGNLYSEEKIKKEKDESHAIIDQQVEELKDKYIETLFENQNLKFENQILKQNA